YPQWKTESEVAVMEYIRLYTNIPVPKVYYWNSSVNNPVVAEYILMEHIPGIHLCDIWIPKYFQDDENNTFILTHRNFYSSNILVNNNEITGIIDWECSGAFPMECLYTYPVWITNSPVIEPTNKKSIEHIILQNFFRAEMSCHNPDFIRTIDNIDKEKKEFYSIVFSYEV
ncbi:7347_t:CDS:2, partial [Gigaspora margarita]